jgi:large subunit ribosomal protein L23
MWNPYSVIENILMSEKSMELKDVNKYIFNVSKAATKIDIARAVEDIYDVKVKDVNVLNRKGKPKRMGRRSLKMGHTASKKRAVVTLSEGSIEVL